MTEIMYVCAYIRVYSLYIRICQGRVEPVTAQWRTEGGLGVQPPPPPKFQSFDKAEPNSQLRGKYIRNNLIRIRDSLICRLSGTSD
jgi:hypothetical protein